MHTANLIFLSTIFAFANQSFSNDLKVHTTLSPNSIRALKPQEIAVIDPNESTDRTKATLKFKAYDGRELLDLAFNGRDGWSKSKEITFECADGYQPSLKTQDFLKGGFYFAYAKTGTSKFELVNNAKDGKRVSLKPYYIIWKQAAMQTRDKAHYWPYQVVGISITR